MVTPHSIPLPDSGLANAGPPGRLFSDKVPAWQFGGEACVIDCRDLLDKAPRGRSPLIKKERVLAWEKKHRPLGPGDVVLFYKANGRKAIKHASHIKLAPPTAVGEALTATSMPATAGAAGRKLRSRYIR